MKGRAHLLAIDAARRGRVACRAMGDPANGRNEMLLAGRAAGPRYLDPAGPTRKALNEAVEQVARERGNTPAVCRRCFIHPLVLDSYLEWTSLNAAAGKSRAPSHGRAASRLRADERLVPELLQRRAAGV